MTFVCKICFQNIFPKERFWFNWILLDIVFSKFTTTRKLRFFFSVSTFFFFSFAFINLIQSDTKKTFLEKLDLNQNKASVPRKKVFLKFPYVVRA